MTPPYDGPFEVMNRSDKVYAVRITEKTIKISVDRLKPAFMAKTRAELRPDPPVHRSNQT